MLARSGDIGDTKSSFIESLQSLRRDRIYGLLAHRSSDLLADDRLWSMMQELKADKLVEKIGASVYDAIEIDALTERFDLDLIQVPLSLLDQRLLKTGRIAALAKQGVEIHARSVFLQGLIHLSPAQLADRFGSVAGHVLSVREALNLAGHSLTSGALAFLDTCPDLTAAVVGVNSVGELSGILAAKRQPHAPFDFSMCAWDEEAVLDPRQWTQ